MSSTTLSEGASDLHDSDSQSSDNTLYDMEPDRVEAYVILEDCEQRLAVNLAQQRSVLTYYAQAHRAMNEITTAMFALENDRAAHSLYLYELFLDDFMSAAEKLEDSMNECETVFGSLQRAATDLQQNVRYAFVSGCDGTD
jgi:hypothetical protein